MGKILVQVDPFVSPLVFYANCQTSDQVNQCVYISEDSVGGVPQVTAVDVTDPGKMPAIGLILSKSSSTDCVVAYFGIVPLPSLEPNARYFVDTTASVIPRIPSARPVIVQVVGQAVDSSRLLLTPSKDLVRLNS